MATAWVTWTVVEQHSAVVNIPDDEIGGYLDEDGTFDTDALVDDLLPGIEGDGTYEGTEDRMIETARYELAEVRPS